MLLAVLCCVVFSCVMIQSFTEAFKFNVDYDQDYDHDQLRPGSPKNPKKQTTKKFWHTDKDKFDIQI